MTVIRRFGLDARSVVGVAGREARRLRHNHLGTEHLLYALAIDSPRPRSILAAQGIDAAMIEVAMLSTVGHGSALPGSAIEFSGRIRDVFGYALHRAAECRQVGSLDLFFGLLRESEGIACQILDLMNADRRNLQQTIAVALTSLDEMSRSRGG